MNQEEFAILIKRYPHAQAQLEFNSGSSKNKPYWKFKRDRSKGLTDAEREHRIAFSEANFGVFGIHGLREVNGVRMPAGARAVQDQLGGKRFAELSASEKRLQHARKRLEASAPRLSQKEVLKQWQKQWDYWKKRAEYDVRHPQVWRPRAVVRRALP